MNNETKKEETKTVVTTEETVTNQDVPETTQTHERENVSGALLKLFAIIGLIGLLALATWMSVQVIRYAPVVIENISSGVGFTSIFNPQRDDRAMDFTLETLSYQSGRPFTLTWSNAVNNISHEYAFSYSCANGTSFKVLRGTDVIDVVCDEPYVFSSMANQLVLVPTSEENRYLDTTIRLERTDDTEIRTEALVTIVNENITDSPDVLGQGEEGPTTQQPGDEPTTPQGPVAETPKPSTPAQPTNPTPVTTTKPQLVYVPNTGVVSDPSGRPDLAVSIIETGIILKTNGEETFYPLATIPSDMRAAVRFEVKNVGTRTSSDDWRFTATLPIEGDPTYTFNSPRQQALNPTDRMEFTLSFDDVITNRNANVEVTVSGERDDARSANDTDSVRLNVSR